MNPTPEYLLDFVIPIGAKGPTGPTGISSIAYATFRNTSTNGVLQFSASKILPNGSSIFSTNNNKITLNERGYYELTISGVLRKSATSSHPSISIQLENNGAQTEFLVITLQDAEEIYFSQNKILLNNAVQNVAVVLSQATGTDVSLSNVNLIIKKFPYA